MATINITDKFSKDKPSIQIGEKKYPVNNSVEAVMKFEEMAGDGSIKALLSSIEEILGKEAFAEIGVMKLPVSDVKVLMLGVMAAMQDLPYEEAAARFQQ
ncbi:hypothetical protein [Paenibacillus sp. VMFN-D1]|uniref:hypothetical protein n=1 Tax=Paenibacillus sp. VMFN-D1 TaxID=2135608 RepID=UPI000E221C86|nr:hypothetical protein [Paenibacillus sp. VMFN-D1]RED34673.1 hypothetical protein C7820_4336 [Paenibacillus sp. VMFN-D1]